MLHYDLIVIGGGIGGCEAAKEASRHQKSVLLIEREQIGGTCLNSGCIPSKFYLSVAKENELFTRDQNLGLFQGELKPQLKNIMEKQQEVVSQLRSFMEQELIEQKIDVLYGEAKLLLDVDAAEKKVQVGKEEYIADYVILANGSSNLIPPFETMEDSLESGFVITNQEIFKTSDISGKVVIIGGGVSGIEMAYALHEFGCQVTIMEASDKILSSIDIDFAKKMQKLYKQKGIEILLNCKVTDIADGCVVYEQDGEEEVYECDKVYLSIGRKGNVDSIPETIKRTNNQRFIETDPFFQTNVAGIYAIGDINGISMLAHSASYQADIAISHILHNKTMKQDNRSVTPHIIYTHPEIAYVGLTEEMAKAADIAYSTVKLPLNYSGRYVVENRQPNQFGMVKLLISEDNTILGGGFMSNYASEEITALVALMQETITCEDILSLQFPHPTEIEVLKNCIKINN